jgi:urea transport system ATP-binding protein
VLGRNGVGKSSLLRAIVGLQAIASGSVTWEDADISALPPYERARRGIGYVPQGREIFGRLTVKENLETGFAPLARGQRTVPDEIYDLFPVLKGMLRRRGGDLSGGQQQQLAIARALVTRPRLLILDEPTEGIQPSIIKDIGRVIKTLAQSGRMAILLVEQYFEFARDLADDFVGDRSRRGGAGRSHSQHGRERCPSLPYGIASRGRTRWRRPATRICAQYRLASAISAAPADLTSLS